ncbi:MAG: sodium:solute symporter [Saprospiraceae bacterium]
MDVVFWQWLLLTAFGIAFLKFGPSAKTVKHFFEGTSTKGKQPNFVMLTSSLIISWIFAKSITNAANLSLSFGMVGAVAYATYYGSFVVAGIIIYQLRTQGGFQSLHHFLQHKYGRGAVYLFSILVGFRLFNEVWSNTMVIGSYFGAPGSTNYIGAVLVFTTLTLLYTLKGGMSSSIFTDAIQMIFFGVLLFIILGIILPQSEFEFSSYVASGTWSMSTGLNLFFVALIQIFSYPFHDAVLTDRGFLSDPKTTLKSFLWASVIGFICIVLFGFVGVHAKLLGLEGQAAVEVGKVLGVGMMLLMNFIMITSAASTLDSAFTSGAKLFVKDLMIFEKVTVSKGRLAMLAFAVLGTLPIFLNPTILSATTISGIMVQGLAPVFLLWKMKSRPIAFHLSVGVGMVIGITLALGFWPAVFIFFEGKYGDLLSANLIGTILCFLCYILGSINSNERTADYSVGRN